MTSSFIHFFHGPASSFSSCFCFWANCFLVRGLATVSEELLELLVSELFLDCEYSEPAISRAAAEMPTVGYARKAGGNFINNDLKWRRGTSSVYGWSPSTVNARDAQSRKLVASAARGVEIMGFRID